MEQNNIFSPEQSTIDITGIDSVAQFTRYNPHDENPFIDGLELAEDLKSASGTIFYTRGTMISHQRISKLIQINESNPNMELLFRIKRSEQLIQNFRDEIKQQMQKLLKQRGGDEGFQNLLSHISDNIENLIDEALSEENVVLAIYKMKFICESNDKKSSVLFFNHSINVALVSLAIASSKRYSTIISGDKAKLVQVCKAGLFHNYGALSQINNILKYSPEQIFEQYWDANQKGFFTLVNLNLNFEIMDSIRFICDYYSGKKDFIIKDDWAAIIANIVLVADTYLQKETGLFTAPLATKEIIDHLNIRAAENDLSEMAVDALTQGLSFKYISEFYKTIETLCKKCKHNSGVPYPLTGFRSPTLYVCKNNVEKCPHIEGFLYSVFVKQPTGLLKQGKYHRCVALTEMLNSYYKATKT